MIRAMCGALALALLTALMGGCGDTERPEWDTQKVTEGKLSYEIPADWKQTDDPTEQGSLIYIPSDADLEEGSANVNLVVMETMQQAPKLSEIKAQFEREFERQIKELFPDAESFAYGSRNAPYGDVLVASYEVAGGMKQTQYYPLIDNVTVVVTATETGAATTPPVGEVADYLVRTIQSQYGGRG